VPFIVTGISQDGNTTALEAALTAAELSLEQLDIIGPEDSDTHVSSSSGLVGSGTLTGGLETGTGVPGLTGSGTPGITNAVHLIGGDGSGSLWDRLADLAIPDDEVENYAEALEAGRYIVAYHGNATNVANLEGIFSSAGLAKVKTF
jgi:hypothetical protein